MILSTKGKKKAGKIGATYLPIWLGLCVFGELLTGHEADYFDFFYDELSGLNGIDKTKREEYVKAYSRPLFDKVSRWLDF